jgi:hypothetical protein
MDRVIGRRHFTAGTARAVYADADGWPYAHVSPQQ